MAAEATRWPSAADLSLKRALQRRSAPETTAISVFLTMESAYFSLEESLARVVGYHTGQHQYVMASEVNRIGVIYHEHIHDRIFNQTGDALLHRFLAAKGQSDGEAARAATFLLEDTRIAHERAATYLGIKQLETPDEREAELRLLPDAYVDYFGFFKQLLEPTLQSTFMQFAAAWAITVWAFQSTRLELLENDAWRDPDALAAIAGPTRRLDKLARVVSGQAGWIRAAFKGVQKTLRKRDIVWVDIDDEAEWLPDANSVKNQVTDRALTAAMSKWLAKNIQLPTMSAERESALAIRNGIQMIPERGVINWASPNLDSMQIESLARDSDRALIHNNKRRIAQPSSIDVHQMRRHLDRMDNMFVTVVMDHGQPQFPFVLHLEHVKGERRFKVDGSPFRVNGEVFEILTKELSSSNKVAPVPLVFRIEEWDNDLNPSRLCNFDHVRVLKASSFDSAADDEGLVVLPFMYVTKNWSRVLGQLGGRLVELDVQLQDEGANGADELTLSCLFPNGDEPPCLKIASRRGATTVLPLVHALAKQGRIERTGPGDLAPEYRNMILAVWDTLDVL